MLNYPSDTEITEAIVQECINEHKKEVQGRLEPLHKMYVSDHKILHADKKEAYKPDNRIVVNFAKYLVDTFNGYFCGVPFVVNAPEEEAGINDYLAFLHGYNDVNNVNAELSKMASVYGVANEIYYVDEDSNNAITPVSPMSGFMVRDDSIKARPLWFIRTYKDKDGHTHGSVATREAVRYFNLDGAVNWAGDWEEHNFGDVPATEFVENEEHQGLFEPAVTMIEAYEKAISEKANDVDYFADAYLKILGASIDTETMNAIRDNRTINISGEDGDKVIVDFLAKPDADATQEHLIDRLERLIFQISMVANISDENFGTASGIAMKYKLQGMDNLAKAKSRKFESALLRRYKLLFASPASTVNADDWTKLNFKFTANIPNNLADEADIAAKLEGVVSKETQLKTLSIVDNVSEEIEALEKESQPVIATRFGADPYAEN